MKKVNKNTIYPVKNYLLIDVPDQGKTTSSGLLLSESSDNKMPVVGKVLKVGKKSEYKIDDEVIFRKFSADEIKVTTAESEKSFWLLESDEVIAVVKDDIIKEEDKYEQIKLKKEINNNNKKVMPLKKQRKKKGSTKKVPKK